MEKIYTMKTTIMKIWSNATNIRSNKLKQQKYVTKHKEGYFAMKKGSIHQEE